MINLDTLPEPTETRERSGKYPPYGMQHRDIDTRYVLGTNADGEKVRVTVSTGHQPNSKAFRTTCTWGLVSDAGDGYLVETWASDHKVTMVHQTFGVARYSLKGMQDHHRRAMQSLRDSWDFHRQVFEEAAREGRLTDETPALATSQP